MCISEKYDWGATLSDINISRLPEQPQQLAAFEKTRGLYARVETGDALFIPKRTWHAVVALEPSISLGVFGLTAPEILLDGGPARSRSCCTNSIFTVGAIAPATQSNTTTYANSPLYRLNRTF